MDQPAGADSQATQVDVTDAHSVPEEHSSKKMGGGQKAAVISLIIIAIALPIASYAVLGQTSIRPKAYEAPATPVVSPTSILPTPTCAPRPACLDAQSHPCKLPQPGGGWCPKIEKGDQFALPTPSGIKKGKTLPGGL